MTVARSLVSRDQSKFCVPTCLPVSTYPTIQLFFFYQLYVRWHERELDASDLLALRATVTIFVHHHRRRRYDARRSTVSAVASLSCATRAIDSLVNFHRSSAIASCRIVSDRIGVPSAVMVTTLTGFSADRSISIFISFSDIAGRPDDDGVRAIQ